jgi:hypothetical protein
MHRPIVGLRDIALAGAIFALGTVAVANTAQAFSLADLSNRAAVTGLKEELIRVSSKATDVLGQADGVVRQLRKNEHRTSNMSAVPK